MASSIPFFWADCGSRPPFSLLSRFCASKVFSCALVLLSHVTQLPRTLRSASVFFARRTFTSAKARLATGARLHPSLAPYWARAVVRMMLIPSQVFLALFFVGFRPLLLRPHQALAATANLDPPPVLSSQRSPRMGHAHAKLPWFISVWPSHRKDDGSNEAREASMLPPCLLSCEARPLRPPTPC